MSRTQIRTLVGLLIVVHLAVAASLTPWHLPADKATRIHLAAIGAIIVQPALLALWAGLAAQPFARRFAHSLAVLACVYLAIDFASVQNTSDSGDAGEIMQPIAWLISFLVCQLPLWLLRRRFGWRFEPPFAARDTAVRNNQFSLRGWFIAMAVVAAFLATLRWLHPATRPTEWGMFLLIFLAMGASMSLPGMLALAVCWLVLPAGWWGRWRWSIAIGVCGAVTAVATAVALFGSPGEVGELVFVLLGTLLSAAGSLLVIRACGYRLVRQAPLGATQFTGAFSAPATSARLPFLLAAALMIVLLATLAALTPMRIKLWREIAQTRSWSDIGLSAALLDGQPICLFTINGANARIDDAAIARISACGQLRELHLLGAAVSDDTLERLAALPNLTRLSLLGARVSDEGIAHLGKFRNLSELDLRMTDLTDDGLMTFAGLHKLVKVDLEHTRVTAEGVAWLSQTKPGLQARASTNDTSLGRIATFFRRGQTYLSREGVTLSRLKLRAIGPGITDKGVALLRGMTQIEDLDLTDARATDSSISSLATLISLKRIVLSGTQVSDSGIARLRQALPDCDVVQ
jgi:hypothetical protein